MVKKSENFIQKINKKTEKPDFPKNISFQLVFKRSPRPLTKLFRNRNAVAVEAEVLETTCRTHLLWSLAPLLTLNHLCLENYVCGNAGFNISKWWKP